MEGRQQKTFGEAEKDQPLGGRLHATCWDPMGKDTYRDSSVSRSILDQCRMLKTVPDVIKGVRVEEFSVARGLELSSPWNKFLVAALVGSFLVSVKRVTRPDCGIESLFHWLTELPANLDAFGAQSGH